MYHSRKKKEKKGQLYAGPVRYVQSWVENRNQGAWCRSSSLTLMLSESDRTKITLNGGHLRWVSSRFLLAVLLQARIVVASRSSTCLWASIFWKVTAVDVLRILLENPWEEKNRRHCLAVKLWLDSTQGEQVIGIQGLDYRCTKCLDCFLEW